MLTLALGIGANAAVFGVVKSVLLDSLPFHDADQLVRVYGRTTDGALERSSLSAGTVTDLVARQRTLSHAAWFYHSTVNATYVDGTTPLSLTGAVVGGSFFSTLGVTATHGRALQESDAVTGADDVVVLSHSTWRNVFAGDPGVVGRTIQLSGDAYVVAGVLPRNFVGPMGPADLFFPLDLQPTLDNPIAARGSHWLGLIGRIAQGHNADAVHREFTTLASAIAEEHPEDGTRFTVSTLPLRSAMAGEVRTPLLVLMASAALVLLIACANLAGALLSRMLSRRREFAVRVALGAGRGRLIRQLLTESTLLALVGGAAGLLIAHVGLAVLRGLALPALPPYAEIALDGGAIAITALLALCTGILFGAGPALSIGRADPQGTLRDETRGSTESRRSRHARGALVAGQLALCVSLLAGAGLLGRSLWAMMAAPLGFDPRDVMTVSLQLSSPEYEDAAVRLRVFSELEAHIRTLPGVTGVATVSELPTGGMNRNGLEIQGSTWPAGAQPFINYVSVSDDYFRTMRIPLLRGRGFSSADGADAPTAFVISAAMERKYWPGGDAVGARIRLGPARGDDWGVIIGVVADVRNDPALAEPEPMSYASSRQGIGTGTTFVIRTAGNPHAQVQHLRRALAAIAPGVPISKAASLEELLSANLAMRRVPVMLMAGFGSLALLLASIGVYAMFASMAAAREREFGVRIALGSSRRNIAEMVVRQGAVWMAAGLAGGAVGVIVVARALRGLLYGVPPFDPIALGAAVALLLVCATAALFVPVLRATRVDPISVLR